LSDAQLGGTGYSVLEFIGYRREFYVDTQNVDLLSLHTMLLLPKRQKPFNPCTVAGADFHGGFQ